MQYDSRATAHLVLWDGRLDQTVGFGFTDAITSSADPDNGYGLSKGQRTKFDYQGNVGLMQGETLVLGAETARDCSRAGYSFGFPSGPATGITTNAGYAEIDSDLGNGLHDDAAIRYDDNSRFGNKVTYHIAPAWMIDATGTKLKASFGTGFKCAGAAGIVRWLWRQSRCSSPKPAPAMTRASNSRCSGTCQRRRHLVSQRHQEPDRQRPGAGLHLRQYRPRPHARDGDVPGLEGDWIRCRCVPTIPIPTRSTPRPGCSWRGARATG